MIPKGSNPLSALWTFPSILFSSFIIAWAAEAAQFLISQGLALAILAWLQTLPEFAVEAVIALAGLYLFLSGAHLSLARKVWLSMLSLLILISTVAGMTVAPPPPSVVAMAATSLVTIVVVCVLFFWIGRPSASAATGGNLNR